MRAPTSKTHRARPLMSLATGLLLLSACNAGTAAKTVQDKVGQVIGKVAKADDTDGVAAAQPASTPGANGCLGQFGYVWNEHWGRCMDPMGACNQGYVLDKAKGECVIYQHAVCALPASDPLSSWCETKRGSGAPPQAAMPQQAAAMPPQAAVPQQAGAVPQQAAAARVVQPPPPAQPASVYTTPIVEDQPVDMKVVNATSERVYVWWHNFNGVPEQRIWLEPGGSYSQSTAVSHVWTANLADGTELSHYAPPHAGQASWTIQAPDEGRDPHATAGPGLVAEQPVAPSDPFYSHGCAFTDSKGNHWGMCKIEAAGPGKWSVKFDSSSTYDEDVERSGRGFQGTLSGGPDSYRFSGRVDGFDNCVGAFEATATRSDSVSAAINHRLPSGCAVKIEIGFND